VSPYGTDISSVQKYIKPGGVSDPDPDSHWISIRWPPDPDPVGLKRDKIKGKRDKKKENWT
jgi:hypothetical protein